MYNDKKEKAKLLALRRAEWRLKQRLETIEYEYEVLRPELEDFEGKVLEGKEPTIEIGPANDV